MHEHPYPRCAYVLSGTLEVAVLGEKTYRYKAGDFIAEVIGQWHNIARAFAALTGLGSGGSTGKRSSSRRGGLQSYCGSTHRARKLHNANAIDASARVSART